MTLTLFDQDFLRKLEYLNLIAKRLVFGRQQAKRPSIKKGASIEFEDYRGYVSGDDPRSIDWAAYARLGELVIKLFRQEEELDLHVLMDASASMDFGEPNKFDNARRIAAALSYIGMCNMDSANVVPFTDHLMTARHRLRGRGHVFGLLEFLTQLESGKRTDLAQAANEFVTRIRRPGLVVIISDFYGLLESQRAIDQLRYHRHQIYLIQLASPWELNPTIRGELRLVDIESSEHADLVITQAMLRKYEAKFNDATERLKRYAMRYSIGYSLCSTEVAFDDFLLDVLQRGRLLA